jgi:RNA polymerase sigma-70 factor (ECF subfamily)
VDAAEAFLEAAGGVADPRQLAAQVTELVDRARRAHPSLTVDDAVFGRYVAARIAPNENAADAVAKLRGDDLFLACACAQGDSRAISEFDRAVLAPAAAMLVRMGDESSIVDEAAQELRARLFLVEHRIVDFSGRGSLAGWVRVSLARQVISIRRSRHPTVQLDEDTAQELASIAPELEMARRKYGDAFRAAFRDAFAELTAEQRSVLSLHFIDGLSLERIARILQISRATVGRRVAESQSALLESFVALLSSRLKATRAEIESLLTIVRSTLYESLAQLLREPE